MLGAIGATCAFPFAGRRALRPARAHHAGAGPCGRTVRAGVLHAGRVRHALATHRRDHPGHRDARRGSAAGVPEYIDRVVSLNAEHQPLIRAGLAWLEQQAKARFSREFLSLGEAEHIAILQPLSDEIDRQRRRRAAQAVPNRGDRGNRCTTWRSPTGIRRHGPRSTPPVAPEADPGLPARFFRLVKNLTADGYYTSRAGLLEELGYAGNTALARFPSCGPPGTLGEVEKQSSGPVLEPSSTVCRL